MNWLAHLRLAPAHARLRIGNLAGDFVRGVDLATLHPEVRRGVLQHRAIDRFVDAHPVVRASRERLGEAHRRFAGVLVDVFYDHFLAREWENYGDGRPLAGFVAEVHVELREHVDELPPRLQEALPWLQREDWLGSYASLAGIDAILARMARRIERPTPLATGGALLRANYAALGADFAAFWPVLVDEAQRIQAEG
ncbi:MAG: DUF479 domain-containing protein [Planctomycetes bacterium]|nr:DUF479 domain-containing protein [Planctomycetota bacterium]MCB9886888.1 DUF479 domain-containing protein [Planctomycetota bacterium]